MPELSSTACFVQAPKAFVAGAIRPYLDTEAVLHISEPLAFIDSTIFKNDISSFLNHLVFKVLCHELLLRIIIAISDSLVARHVLHMQIGLVMEVSGHPFPSNLTSEEGLNVDDLVDMLLVTLLKAINELGKNCRTI